MSDETVAVRAGESVDAEALGRWLSVNAPAVMPVDATVTVRQFPAGFSNLTYRVTIRSTEDEREYVLRRPPRGVKAGSAHDMQREFRILEALTPLAVPVPSPIVASDDASVIGAPFYLMSHVDGVILRGTTPVELAPDAAARSAQLAALSNTFVKTLVRLHEVDVTVSPLRELGRPEGYVARQVQGWTRRWHASRTSDVSEMENVAKWLDAHRPPDRGASLIHNDFKFDNLILDRADITQLRAILDWEMATVGDPLMDLGTSLAYWVEASDVPIFRALGLGVTALPGCYSRAELLRAYATLSGRDVSDAPYYYVFGLFKLAVIAQQIYARSVQGLTADPRFAMLADVVRALADTAETVAQRTTV